MQLGRTAYGAVWETGVIAKSIRCQEQRLELKKYKICLRVCPLDLDNAGMCLSRDEGKTNNDMPSHNAGTVPPR